MLTSYTQDRFPTDYVPTVFDNHTATLKVNNFMVNLGLWDTAGQEEYVRLRTLAYANCDLFVVVCDVTNKDSLTNVCKKWLPELNSLSPESIKLVVGNKIDFREEGRASFTKEEAEARLEGLKAEYLECSAKTQQGLKQVFSRGIGMVLEKKFPKKKKSDCCLV